ncbi:MAG: endonuclease III [Lachnospiraceae bacterium]|nr:endonuclease III [Lachnospiraceae bacterium]
MKKRTQEILAALDARYGTEHRCYLNHENAWQLLIATMLSAQCTDARVNIVTKDLFQKYRSVEDFARADLKELEQDIHSTGFYHNKAKNIIACCRTLLEKHNGEVPSSLEELTELAGVGRKTANVIRGNIFGEPSIVVDTHVKRISKKLGLTGEDDPVKVELDLMKELPKDHWILWNIHIITLGRTICKAPTPRCEECFLQELCPDFKKRSKSAAADASGAKADTVKVMRRAGKAAGKRGRTDD